MQIIYTQTKHQSGTMKYFPNQRQPSKRSSFLIIKHKTGEQVGGQKNPNDATMETADLDKPIEIDNYIKMRRF